MKRILTLFVVLAMSASATFGQALVHIFHNSPGAETDSIDFRFTTPLGVLDTTITNVNYREIFLIPVGTDDSLSIELFAYIGGVPVSQGGAKMAPLTAGSLNVMAFTGLANTTGFDVNPNGRNIGLNLLTLSGLPTAGGGNVTASFSLFHGATDLQAVDIRAIGPGYDQWLADDLTYGEFNPTIITVPATQYLIEIWDSTRTNMLKKIYANLATAAPIPGGAVATVFLSGGVNTAQQPEYNLFAGILGLPSGPAIPFRIVKESKIQFVYNVADPAIDTVDFYVIGAIDSTEIGVLDNVSLHMATELSSIPSNTPLRFIIAPSNSTGLANALTTNLFTIPVTELTTDKSYIWVANGVSNSTLFDANPDGEATDLNVYRRDTLTVAAPASGTADVIIFNGATDLANIDVDVQGGATLATDLKYGRFSALANVTAGAHTLTVTTASGVRTYNLDLAANDAQRVVLFFSGFVDATQNADAPLELWAAEQNGNTYKVSEVTGISETSFATGINLFPNPATANVRMSFTLANTSEVQYRLVNMVGQTVGAADLGTLNAGANNFDVNVSNLSAGVYMLNLVSNGASVNVPVIVSK